MACAKSYVEQLIRFLKDGSIEIVPELEDRIRLFALRKKEEGEKKTEDGQLSFGKYSGKTIDEVARFDIGYVKWLQKNDKYVPPRLKEDIIRVLKN